jgi:hypothetical protein
MTSSIYFRRIVPIALLFSLSLIWGNKAYLYLSVASIQMFKVCHRARTPSEHILTLHVQTALPVAVLIAAWAFRQATPTFRTLRLVSIIVIGGIVTSFGTLEFNLKGLSYQILALFSHAVRLVMTQSLLTTTELDMGPLLSLYYFAPVGTVIVGLTSVVVEVPNMAMVDIYNVGLYKLLLNAMLAFAVNVATFLLVGQLYPATRV